MIDRMYSGKVCYEIVMHCMNMEKICNTYICQGVDREISGGGYRRIHTRVYIQAQYPSHTILGKHPPLAFTLRQRYILPYPESGIDQHTQALMAPLNRALDEQGSMIIGL